MIIRYTTILLILLCCAVDAMAQFTNTIGNPIDCVDSRFGTASNNSDNSGVISHGYIYPAIALPFGMNHWTPQTGRFNNRWMYSYNENFIYGFKQTHSASPWMGDYGHFSLMPVTGKRGFTEDDRRSWFSHLSEEAHPYYYSVYLGDHNVTAEITPTERAAIFRFTFASTDSASIVIDAMGGMSFIEIIAKENKIIGYTTKNNGGVPDNFKNYFIIKFDAPFAEVSLWLNDKQSETMLASVEGDHAGAVIRLVNNGVVHARVASSFISIEQAELNLKELGNDDFDTIKEKARNTWNNELNRISISGCSVDQYRTFYSCLYRMLLFPRKFYEINADGDIMHYSPYNGKVLPGYMFTDIGFWDVFRAQMPFLNLMYPKLSSQIMEGMANAYKESGWLPEWAAPGHRDCMIGSHSASVIADSYLKGDESIDIQTLYEGILKNSESEGPLKSLGRRGVDYYNVLGYIPCDVGINQNASMTLEYAYDDFTIYQLSKKLGRTQDEIDRFATRCNNYKKLFNPKNMLMCERKENGDFSAEFNPFRWGDAFTEGNSWQYTWFVPHDIVGLQQLMGGESSFFSKLDSLFTISPSIFDASYYQRGTIHLIREMQAINMGQYAHGNEPSHHIPYIYNWGQPWKAQELVRKILTRLYKPTSDGLPGDDDNGQMSAWYVFSSLGFYPFCPGTNEYVIGSPLFKEAKLVLENGKIINLISPDNDSNRQYIRSVTVNGDLYTKNWFSHKDLIKGCDIRFDMSESPNKKRGINKSDYPYSFSVETLNK